MTYSLCSACSMDEWREFAADKELSQRHLWRTLRRQAMDTTTITDWHLYLVKLMDTDAEDALWTALALPGQPWLQTDAF